MKVRSYECWVDGYREHAREVNHVSLGKAKAEFWRDVCDCWPDLPFTAIRGRSLGSPWTSPQLKNTAEYRGVPGLQAGDEVEVGGRAGWVVGSDASANFRVVFQDGGQGSVHVSEMVIKKKEVRSE